MPSNGRIGFRLAIRHPNGSGSGSEEKQMSRIALSHEIAKLMKLCDLEGFKRLDDLLKALGRCLIAGLLRTAVRVSGALYPLTWCSGSGSGTRREETRVT